MPNVVPPMAKTVIRRGIIQRSLPRKRRTSSAMPAWMAPVFMVMPMNPPMTRMNRATSMAPNSSPLLKTSMLPVSASSMPYRPLIGASSESTRMRCGLESTSWYVPGIGEPSASRSYCPAGMIHVATAVMTISANRIVYADGSENLDFFSAGGAVSVVSVSFGHQTSSVRCSISGGHEGGHGILRVGNPIVETGLADAPRR